MAFSQDPRRTMRGFLLLETAFALVLVIGATLTLNAWYMHTINMQAQAYNRLQALTLACSQLEKIHAFKCALVDESMHDQFTIQVEEKNGSLPMLKYYTVLVRWCDHAKEHTVALTTGVVEW